MAAPPPDAPRRTAAPDATGRDFPRRDFQLMSATPNDVLAALSRVQDPDLHRDLVTLGMIEEVAVSDGRAAFTLVLTTSACPLKAQIEDDCRAAVLAVPGIREVEIRTTSRVRKAT